LIELRRHLALVGAVALASGGVARAGDLYVNGVRADGLADFEFTDVTVRIDREGNVWIDAPTYRVEVNGETAAAPDLSTPVPAARYWLVTEDNGSKGLTIDVVVNGRVVRKLRSGEPQAILDVGEYLQRGTNTVIINAVQSRNASGGIFYVYVGEGSNESGTLMLDKPEITFAQQAESSGDARVSRSFELTVP